MLARYRKGLTDLQEGLKAGAERMMKRREGEKKYWEEVVELAGYPKSSETEEENGDGEKTVPWSIRLRELAHAAYEIPQDRQMASDVFIPIAADEGESPAGTFIVLGGVLIVPLLGYSESIIETVPQSWSCRHDRVQLHFHSCQL